MMTVTRGWASAVVLGGLFLIGGSATSQASEPFVVRPAIYHSSAQSSTQATVTPVFHRRHYGGYYSSYGYRPYAYGYSSYGYRGYGVGYSPYVYSSYRPYYTYPQGYARYGYYSYPSYRAYAYPYAYVGPYTTGYYGGGVYAPYAVGYAPPVVVSSSVITAPYSYGGFYSYPQYGGYYGYGW